MHYFAVFKKALLSVILMTTNSLRVSKRLYKLKPGSTISNGREPKTNLGRVFNFKLDRFASRLIKIQGILADTSRVEYSAQANPC
jgi:hypothetical protein